MDRREFLKFSSAGALSVLGGCASKSVSPQENIASAASVAGDRAKAPDIVLFLTDDHNARCVGYAGDSNAISPHIDEIGKNGVIFDAMYTPTPVCMPSRCSLATGLYPHSLELLNNTGKYTLDAKTGTIFQNMKQAGYFTAQIGKLHYGSVHDNEAIGLDYAEHISSPSGTCFGNTSYQEHLRQKGILEEYCRDIADRFELGQYYVRPSVADAEDYNDTFITRKAIEFMRNRPVDKPVFLIVGLPGPHTPMDAPKKYHDMFDPEEIELPANVPDEFYWSSWDKNNNMVTKEDIKRIRANYYGKIALLDDCVGELVAALKERGKWNNTLFVYASDHGEMMGAHGKMSKGKFWEESARVPCVMSWPDVIAAGQRSDALCQLFDLYSTFVEAGGGKDLPRRASRSVLPIALGKKEQIRDAVFGEIGRDKLDFMVRQGRYKWFHFADAHYDVEQSEYLYDLEEDPLEMRNLIDSPEHQEIITKLKLRHLKYFKQTQRNLAAKSKSLYERHGADARTKKKVNKEGLADRMFEKFKKIQGF